MLQGIREVVFRLEKYRPRHKREAKAHKLAIAMVTIALVAVASLIQPVGQAVAAATVPFEVKYTTNANGAIITIGNNLLTCPPGSISNTVGAIPCADARAGAAVNNNSYIMAYLDADSVSSTFNSSSSQLNLPAGASVLWAGLYWGARLTAGTGGKSSPATGINQMSLRAPGDTAYRVINASQAAHDLFGPNTASYSAYQRFADVTNIVRAAGNGDYWGANVVTGTGMDRYAGWALTVVYTAPSLPLRNLTVFDGFALVQSAAPQTITVSGFQAPLAGAVGVQLSMVAYEGDLAQSGDSASLNGTQLATALSPGSNFFNSANGLNGASVATRTPADVNMLGFDIKNLGASGAIPNGATSAQFQFSSTGDTYYPGVLGLAINLYAPDFSASAKTVVNLSGNVPARPGDKLAYTVTFANTGQDPAVDVVSADVLPPGVTYVPGSLALLNPATSLTDAADNDVGEYIAATNTIRVRLGGGADGTNGGRMDWSSTTHPGDGTAVTGYTFQVILGPACAGTTVSNAAALDYVTGTTGIAATYTTPAATIDVPNIADVAITKTLSPSPAPAGAAVTATITVKNNGPNKATAVVVSDQLPSDWQNISVDSALCSITSTNMTCNLGDMSLNQQVVIKLTGRTSPSLTSPSLTNVASVTTTAIDPTPENNISGDTVLVSQQADLSVTKTALPSSAAPGAGVTWTIKVANAGPSDAVGVKVTDMLNDASQATITGVALDTATAPAGSSCLTPTFRSATCSLATLPAGATTTVTVTGTLSTDLALGAKVTDTASVTSNTPDPTPANNTATATITATAPSADVRVTKTGPTTVAAGQPITWTITATNYGPSDATGVKVTDTVVGTVTNLVLTTTRGTCAAVGQDVTCTIGTLHSAGAGVAGEAAIITITGDVAPSATGILNNMAMATATSTDPVPTNNGASSATTTQMIFDIGVTKTANRSSLPSQSDPVDYTITVTNKGPAIARNVNVTDLVPAGLQIVSVTPASCTSPVPASDPAYQQFTCFMTTAIPPGGTQTVTVHTVASTDLAAAGNPLSETVTVSAIGDDQTKLADNTATWVLSGAPQIDLSLTKTALTQAVAGDMFDYGFVVRNNQSASDPDFSTADLTASPPTVTDTLPPGVTLVASGATVNGQPSNTPTWCSAAGGVVTCNLPATMTIPPGDTQSFSISVRVDPAMAAGTIASNTATVTPGGAQVDPVMQNNTATATSTTQVVADVAVENFTVASPIGATYTGPGSQRVVNFDVVNNGPSTATQVQFRATRDVDAVAALPTTPAGISCTDTVRAMVCTLPADLAPGARIPISYTITLPGYVTPGTYDDSVYISATSNDPDLGNNAATASITVGAPQTALTITKQAQGTVANPNVPAHQSFIAGGPFAYQITVQVAGDLADAVNSTLADTMPAGFIAQRVDTSLGTCAITGAGSAVSCNLGTIASGAGEPGPAVVVVTVRGVLAPNAVLLNTTNPWAENVSNQATITCATSLRDAIIPAVSVVDIIEQTDLQLIKTPDEATINAGGIIGYALTVLNTGPSDAAHIVVTDTLPAGFTYNAALSNCTPPQTSPVDETAATPQRPAGAIACRIGSIPAGSTAAVYIVANTSYSMSPGTAINYATVGSLGDDPDLTNNQASANVTIARLTDLGISSTVSTTTPIAGQDITFTGYALNNGPSSADNTSGETVFPAGFVPVSYSVEFNNCTWSPPAPANPYAQPWQNISYTLRCVPVTPGASWEPGGAATNLAVMHIPEDTPAGSYYGTSSITSNTPETNTDNNVTTQEIYVQRASDTAITKTLVGPDPMEGGQPATWRLTVVNDGPSVAANVEISDTVPKGMSFIEAEVENGSVCPLPQSEGGQMVVRCSLSQLNVGEEASVLVTFKIGNPGGEVCNTGVVGSGSLDPVDANNASAMCGMADAAPPGPAGTSAETGGYIVPDPPPGALVAALLVMTVALTATVWWRRRVTSA